MCGETMKKLWKERWMYFATSWVCVSWMVIYNLGIEGMTPLLYGELSIMVFLFLVWPLYPVYGSIIYVVSSIILWIMPFPSLGAYWISTMSFYASIIVLGMRKGRIRLSVICLVVVETLYLVTSLMQYQIVSGFCSMLFLILLAWTVGVIIRFAINNQKQLLVAEEKERYRSRQLEMLHVLHDSVANDLVYVVTRCRSLNLNNQDNLLDDICVTLEHCLSELRQRVIIPERQHLESQEINDTRIESEVSHNEVYDIKKCMSVIGGHLSELGFIGEPQCLGPLRLLSNDVAHVIVNCINELSSNIAKHGVKGEYILTVVVEDSATIIISSNKCSPESKDALSSSFSSGAGLMLLEQMIHDINGSMSYGKQDGEWVTYITIPHYRSEVIL
ncbi:hypothetical protein [Bifidobacterium oedipodis]|uniref:Signal transduction histidine kinase n=1 Tax=Bifidobacterium oedipodis TaxID=2675322 RepID=A0A7Y0EM94_9BIFI|nr:hypothetical protein [Bifidobacterium sp. DSM 109957]NMM92847.1 signal transduction histidine kinase [Bifidobacterium sp. DSM 109957]